MVPQEYYVSWCGFEEFGNFNSGEKKFKIFSPELRRFEGDVTSALRF